MQGMLFQRLGGPVFLLEVLLQSVNLLLIPVSMSGTGLLTFKSRCSVSEKLSLPTVRHCRVVMDKQLLDKLVGIIMDESSNAFERNAALVMLANIDDPSALSALKAIYKASENKDPFIRTYIRSRMANFGLEDLDSGKPTRRSSERREKPWWRFWRKSFEFREAICQPLVPPPGAMS